MKRETLYEERLNAYRSSVRFGVIAVMILLILCGIVYVRDFCYIKISVSGASMQPTFYTGDVVNARVYEKPDYFSVIIISGEKENGDWLIKRAIAFGGDTVRITGGYVYLKRKGETEFKKLNESYVASKGSTYPAPVNVKNPLIVYEKTVEDGCVFYLGDNRMNSNDSRSSFGTCRLDQVVAVVSQTAIDYKGVSTFMENVQLGIIGFFQKLFKSCK